MNLTYLLNYWQKSDKAGFVEASPIRTNHSLGYRRRKMSLVKLKLGPVKQPLLVSNFAEKLMSITQLFKPLVIARHVVAVQSQEEWSPLVELKEVQKFALSMVDQALKSKLKLCRSGAHIVGGTPGRLLDLIKRKALKLDHLALSGHGWNAQYGWLRRYREAII